MKLMRTFDRRSLLLADQVTAFQEEIAVMEKAVAPALLVTHTRREGNLLHVTVMSALRTPELAAHFGTAENSVVHFSDAWW